MNHEIIEQKLAFLLIVYLVGNFVPSGIFPANYFARAGSFLPPFLLLFFSPHFPRDFSFSLSHDLSTLVAIATLQSTLLIYTYAAAAAAFIYALLLNSDFQMRSAWLTRYR